jgi:tetratricopeptide (TPR) repeat protein
MRLTASRLFALALVAAVVGFPAETPAQSMRDAKICDNTASPPVEIIRACSLFLRSKRFPNGNRLPNNVIAANYVRRASAYSRIYEFDRAIEDYSAALEISPTPADVLSSRGFSYAAAGNDDLALADFEASLRINPKQAFSLQGRGSVYLRRMDYDRALADFNQSIAINPKLAWTYNGRANVFYVKGDNTRGDADIQKALQLEPASRAAFEETADFTKHWLQYLREIQNDRDYANWSRPPFEAYTSAR